MANHPYVTAWRSRECLCLVLLLAAGFLPTAALSQADRPNQVPGFPVSLEAGSTIFLASMALADVSGDGIDDILIGTTDGKIHVYTGTGGTPAKLWSFDTGAVGINSRASVADVDADGFPEVVVGTANLGAPVSHGGLYVINHLGQLQCQFLTRDVEPGPGGNGLRDHVLSTPALADLDGNDGGALEISFGAFDRFVRAIHHDCSLFWEVDVIDSIFSSAAIGDVNDDGQLDVVIGAAADSDQNLYAPGKPFH